MAKLKSKIIKAPNSPGVYLMKSATGEIIYVGKATSLKERLRSYLASDLPLKTRKQMLEVADIEVIGTESPVEALFLESKLIKKYSPKFNIKEKDDKSRLYVYFTKEKFPAIKMIRETDLAMIKEKRPILYGPYSSSKSVSDAIELVRRVFPFRTCRVLPSKKCLYGYIGLCNVPCEGLVSEEDYLQNIKSIRKYFKGERSQIIKQLEKQQQKYSRDLRYEEAAKKRDQVSALKHLSEMFVLSRDDRAPIFERIEGYDISNILGQHAVGSMVVFTQGLSDKSEYRKFKIKSVHGANDVAMMKEVLSRRFNARNRSWPKPDLIIIDGGRGQVNAAISVLRENNFNIPVIGIAKGKDRKRDEIITSKVLPRQEITLFKQIRDEAHRFAKGYYKKLHSREINPTRKAR